MRPYLTILGKEIPLYGIFCTLGIAIAVIIALLIAKKQGYEFFDFMLIVVYTLIGAFVGAKLLFLIVSWESVVAIFSSNSFFDSITILMRGGYVFYGGLIGGVLALFVILRVKKYSFINYASLFAVVLTIGHAFGRIGCFFGGCCYGMVYDGFLSIEYTSALDLSTPIGVKLLPIQLIEAFCLLILFGVLMWLYFKCKKHKIIVIFVYALSYALIRFILEFFRGDVERGVAGGLSTSQWISIAIMIIALTYLIVYLVRNYRSPSRENKCTQNKANL